jgi:hypothetical protein
VCVTGLAVAVALSVMPVWQDRLNDTSIFSVLRSNHRIYCRDGVQNDCINIMIVRSCLARLTSVEGRGGPARERCAKHLKEGMTCKN